uniref:Toprim domain-containing protein n=1 Tax=Cucumis melo TaxID=3656 RepID=A0A9I9EMX0_CUCME
KENLVCVCVCVCVKQIRPLPLCSSISLQIHSIQMPINSTFTFNSNFNFNFKFIHRSSPSSLSLNNFSISSSPSRFLLRFCTTRLSSALSHAPPLPPPENETPPFCLFSDFEVNVLGYPKVKVLREKMDLIGIVCDEHCIPGKYYCLFCPKIYSRLTVQGWSFNGEELISSCDSNWIFADGRLAFNGFSKTEKMVGRSSKESLVLEPLCDEMFFYMVRAPPVMSFLGAGLISYFSMRMISQETLERNVVMQVVGRQVAIAFTYRQNGQLVGCKYRTMDKRFWQEKGTAKFLYGIDDINDADELIIVIHLLSSTFRNILYIPLKVEGEMDKLSVEEAGFLNCISVPGGAPSKVSTDTIPPIEKREAVKHNFEKPDTLRMDFWKHPQKDSAYQYLWGCKDYLDKVSRIILATDSDVPGQALAEELARRLGKHRCWRVDWPYKDGFNRFKDANEVTFLLSIVIHKVFAPLKVASELYNRNE